jgi:hypothetical protein
MLAEQRAPDIQLELSKSSAVDDPASAGPVGGTSVDRLPGLDVRAQSALLQQAFEKQDPVEVDGQASVPSPKRGFIERFGWRAFKSALGLGLFIVAGIGPVQRSSTLASSRYALPSRAG